MIIFSHCEIISGDFNSLIPSKMSLRIVSDRGTSDLYIYVTLGCIPSVFQQGMELQLLQLEVL